MLGHLTTIRLSWTMQRVIIGLPLAVALAFCFSFVMMHPQTLTANSSSKPATKGSLHAQGVSAAVSLPLSLAPKQQLPAIQSSQAEGDPTHTATPQQTAQSVTNLQSANTEANGQTNQPNLQTILSDIHSLPASESGVQINLQPDLQNLQ